MITIVDENGTVAGHEIGGGIYAVDSPPGLVLAEWLQSGVPVLRGVQVGDLMSEEMRVVPPSDPFFGLALLSRFDYDSWRVADDGREMVANVFCPTGPGGGINPHCSPDTGQHIGAGGASPHSPIPIEPIPPHSDPAPKQLHSPDAVVAHLKDHSGQFGKAMYSQTLLEQVHAMNPNGIKDGVLHVPKVYGSPSANEKQKAQLEVLAKIMPPGTVIKTKQVTHKKLGLKGEDVFIPKAGSGATAAPKATGTPNTFGELQPGHKFDFGGQTHTVTSVSPVPGEEKLLWVKTDKSPHSSLLFAKSEQITAPPPGKIEGQEDPGKLPATYGGLQPGHKYTNSLYKEKVVESVEHKGGKVHIKFKGEDGVAVLDPSTPLPKQQSVPPSVAGVPPAKPSKAKAPKAPPPEPGNSPWVPKPETHKVGKVQNQVEHSDLPPITDGGHVTMTLTKQYDKAEHEAWRKSLTPAESQAISGWKGSAHAIRYAVATDTMNSTAKAFMSGIEKSPTYQGVTYRGVHGEYAEQLAQDIIKAGVGGTWSDPSPHCMSLNPYTGNNFSHGQVMFRILTKTGRPIHKEDGFAGDSSTGEKEVVGMPGTKYKIAAIAKNVKIADTHGNHMPHSPVKYVIDLVEA